MPRILITVGLLFIAMGAGSQGHAATHVVRPDGQGDFPTIQAALDAALGGDIIELTDGTFTGDGNRDLDFLGKSLSLCSQCGDPQFCTIDCQGSVEDPHRGFHFDSGESSQASIIDITVANGYGHPEVGTRSLGGAIFAESGSVSVSGCRFVNNFANEGGVIHCRVGVWLQCASSTFTGNGGDYGSGVRADSSAAILTACSFSGNYATLEGGGFSAVGTATAQLTDCTFVDNYGGFRGGAVYCGEWSAAGFDGCTFVGNYSLQGGAANCCNYAVGNFTACTFHANEAPEGGGSAICTGCSGHAELERCILAFGTSGGSVHTFSSGTLLLSCCDVYGNVGGDWVEAIADQFGVDGNFSADPLFCDAAGNDLTLHQDSPCLAGRHPLGAECAILGAWPVGCPIAPVGGDPPESAFLRLLSGSPNPTRGMTRLAFWLAEDAAEPVVLRIFDAAGRCVRSLDAGRASAGRHTVHWDATDDRGRSLAAGAYFCRLGAHVRVIRLIR